MKTVQTTCTMTLALKTKIVENNLSHLLLYAEHQPFSLSLKHLHSFL